MVDEAIPPSSLDQLRAEATRFAGTDEESEEDEVLWLKDKAGSFPDTSTDLAGANEQVAVAVKALQDVIAKLIEGLLSPAQIEKLVTFARDVIQACQEESLSDQSSTSFLAEQVVQEAIKQVQTEVAQRIFPTYGFDRVLSDTSLLAQQIVKEALDQSKLEAEMFLKDQASDTSSTSHLAEHIVRETLKEAEQDIVADVLGSESDLSGSSQIAEHVVEQTLEQVKYEIAEEIMLVSGRGVSVTSLLAEQITDDAVRLLEFEFSGHSTLSSTLPDDILETVTSASDLARYVVNHAIKMAVTQMQAASAGERLARPSSAPPGSQDDFDKSSYVDVCSLPQPKSFSSQLVMDVLTQVANQLKEEAVRESSDTSIVQSLIHNALNDAALEINERSSFDNVCDWDSIQPLKTTSSTVTGDFVLSTLRSTIFDLESNPEYLELRSESALRDFSEALVGDALEDMLRDISSEASGKKELINITATILRSNTHLRKYPSHSVDKSSSLSSTKSHVVEQIMLHSLLSAKSSLNKMDLIKVGAQVDVTGLMSELDKRCVCTEGRSDTSILGDICVRDALETAVYDVFGDYPDIGSDNDTIDILVREALQNAAEDLKFQSSKQLLDSEASLVVQSSMSLAAESIVSRLMDSTLKDLLAPYVRTSSHGSLSSQSLTEHNRKDVDSDASLIADTLVDGTLVTSLQEARDSRLTDESPSLTSPPCEDLKTGYQEEAAESYTSLIADMLVNDAIDAGINEALLENSEMQQHKLNVSHGVSAVEMDLQDEVEALDKTCNSDSDGSQSVPPPREGGNGGNGTSDHPRHGADDIEVDNIVENQDVAGEYVLQARDSLQLLRESSHRIAHPLSSQEELSCATDSCDDNYDIPENTLQPGSNLALKTKSSLELLHKCKDGEVAVAVSAGGGEKAVTLSDETAGPSGFTSKLRRESHVGNIVIDDIVVYDSESSEDEAPIIPSYDGHAANIDHHIVEHALSVISAKHKNDIAQMQLDSPVQRASFRDIHHPDLHKLRRFSHDSEEALCEKVTTISCQKLVQDAAMSHQSSSFFASSLENTIKEVLESESSSDGESLPEEKVISEEEIHSIQDFIEVHSTSKTSEDDILHSRGVKEEESSKQIDDKTTSVSKARRASMPHNFLSKKKTTSQSKLKVSEIREKKREKLQKEKEPSQISKVRVTEKSSGHYLKETKRPSKPLVPGTSKIQNASKQTKSKETKHSPRKNPVSRPSNHIKEKCDKMTSLKSPEKQALTSATNSTDSVGDRKGHEDIDQSNDTGKVVKAAPSFESQPQTPEEDLDFDTVSYTQISKSGTKAMRKKASSKVVPPKDTSSQSEITFAHVDKTDSFCSVQSSKSKAGSHQSISLRPRPSSGYQKSVSRQSATSTTNTAAIPTSASTADTCIPLTPKSSVSNLDSDDCIHKHHHGGSCSDACTHSDNSGYAVDAVNPDLKPRHPHHLPKRDYSRSSTGSLPGLSTTDRKVIQATNRDFSIPSKSPDDQVEKFETKSCKLASDKQSSRSIVAVRSPEISAEKRIVSTLSVQSRLDSRLSRKESSNRSLAGSQCSSAAMPVDLSPKSSVSTLKSFTEAKSGSRMSLLRDHASVESVRSDVQAGLLPSIGASYHHHKHTNHHHGHFFHHDAHVHNRRDPMHTSTGSLPGLSVDTDPLCHAAGMRPQEV